MIASRVATATIRAGCSYSEDSELGVRHSVSARERASEPPMWVPWTAMRDWWAVSGRSWTCDVDGVVVLEVLDGV